MGVDLIRGGNKRKRVRSEPVSVNPYLRVLVKLYAFLSRRTGSAFNKTVLKRLMQARRFQRPISLRRLGKLVAKRQQTAADKSDKIIAVIGTVTNDARDLDVPKIRICALKVTEAARKRIVAKGGEVLTFDQLATISPDGKGVVLLRGGQRTEVRKSFGAPIHGSKPKVASTSRKAERARGRRASRGYRLTKKHTTQQ